MTPDYFHQLSDVLKKEQIARPVLVIDKAALDHNIQCLKKTLDSGLDYRIVAKSLPSIPLLKYIMKETNTTRLMSFHLPFLQYLIEAEINDLDILFGKPMPLAALKEFYTWIRKYPYQHFQPEKQLQWLIDSVERLKQYEAYAESENITLNINLEVDVGLHRGGFSCLENYKQALFLIERSAHLRFSGLMGYEAHITKIPLYLGGPKLAEFQSKKRYRAFADLAVEKFGESEGMCLNAAGSSTYPLYSGEDVCNEISVASALVKPSDFDVYTLEQHRPAMFIASPILKVSEQAELPMASVLSTLMRKTGVLPKRSAFIYGGNWMADPVWPDACKRVDLFGHSSNQEMYGFPENTVLNVDDFVFFRPQQSEALMLQFGHIALMDNQKISEWWPVFSYPDSIYDAAKQLVSD